MNCEVCPECIALSKEVAIYLKVKVLFTRSTWASTMLLNGCRYDTRQKYSEHSDAWVVMIEARNA